MRYTFRTLWQYCCIFVAVVLPAQLTYASLMIKPSRVVLDERNRTTEVTLLNSSDTTKVYHIEWEEKKQTTAGSYIDVDSSTNEFKASSMISHSPRKVTIKPGEYQKIKLRADIPRDLAEGEYRSHLLMRVVNDEVAPTDDGAKGQKLVIIPLLSFTIPVMVRKGPPKTTSEITSIQQKINKDGQKQLQVNLKHQGDYSSYGNLYAYMKVGTSSTEKIGEIHNIALFRETSQRIVNIPLHTQDIPKGAIIQVLYKGEDEFEGKILGKAAMRYE